MTTPTLTRPQRVALLTLALVEDDWAPVRLEPALARWAAARLQERGAGGYEVRDGTRPGWVLARRAPGGHHLPAPTSGSI